MAITLVAISQRVCWLGWMKTRHGVLHKQQPSRLFQAHHSVTTCAFENHLLTVGSASSYTYDADGNRLSVATSTGITNYLVDTNAAFARVLEEYSGSTLAARYDYGDDLLRRDRSVPSTSTSYYFYDGLGSTRQLINSAGTVTDTYLYDAYGVGLAHAPPTGGTINSFLFQGQQFNTVSNDYYQRARYYDLTTGRSISQDPIGDGTNWYAYCAILSTTLIHLVLSAPHLTVWGWVISKSMIM